MNKICNEEWGAKYVWCDRHIMRFVRWKRNKENGFWWPWEAAFTLLILCLTTFAVDRAERVRQKWQSSLIGGKPSSVMAATVKPVSFPSPSLCVCPGPSLDYRLCSSGILTVSPARLLYVGLLFACCYVYSLWTLSGSGVLSVTSVEITVSISHSLFTSQWSDPWQSRMCLPRLWKLRGYSISMENNI